MYSKNIWKDASQEKVNAIMNFCEDYKHFISVGKTERICVKEALKIAESKGFKNLHDVKTANVGDKLYLINKNIRNKSYIYMENKQVDKKTHKTYNKNISLEMLSSLGAGDGDSSKYRIYC